MDHNATTPLDPRVFEAMTPFLTTAFGNSASRSHSYGHDADQAVEAARAQTAKLLNAADKEIIWTSGATEANNLAIKGVAYARRDRGRHIITQATEHHAVLDPCRWLSDEGFDVTVLPVDAVGRVDPDQVICALRADTILVSIMWANNEIGTIQPIREIGIACQNRNILFHTDATQAVGKLSIDLAAEPVDLLSLSAHKFYGPKGSGALYVRTKSPRIKLVPLFHGGGHERGMRSGTINVPGVVGLGAACDLCRRDMAADATKLSALRDQLEQGILSRVSGVRVNGDIAHRLPQTTHLSFDDVEAEGMLVALRDVALSTGSACTSANMEPSHVLSALGLPEAAIYSSIRFGLGRDTTVDHVRHVTDRVIEAVDRLRGLRQLA
jgi:cysteine desulfurase